ncbi:MAG: 4Fe-4S dicluster domain-containing protein [Nitrospinota bacterium]|nr:4Fe-4S dicluster domain-containing protein [Nitrospinota bacterium]MDP7386475.1 4Fe-4S dicluster domain-containing protein [Nitrospinota bacterium]
MPRWGMVIDLTRCVGCYACSMACKVENGTPPGVWYSPVYEKETGTYPTVNRMFIPTLCNHCRDAPCAKACPTGALQQRGDGIVEVDSDRCCGSRACMNACPYGALHFYENGRDDFVQGSTPFGDRAYAGLTEGTVMKCTFCSHRIDQRNLTPACVQTCPTECRHFGDLDDPESNVSRLIREKNGSPLRPEAETDACVFYLR